jgi:lysophospholipase L1-like esterase
MGAMRRSVLCGLVLSWLVACGGDDSPSAAAPGNSAPGGENPGALPGAAGVGGTNGTPTGGSNSEAPGDIPLDGTAAGATTDTGEPPLGPVDTTLHAFEADDPNIVYSGRVDFSDAKQPTYSAPATTISVRFNGDSISALLGDEFRYGSERSFYDVIVDGQVVSKLTTDPALGKYELASGLTPGAHSISLVKRTQAQLGKGIFRGFEVNGTLLAPAAAPSLKFDFIGDSVTAGEGADAVNGSAECGQNAAGTTGGWGQPFHNADLSYAVLASRALGAEYQLTAVSGIGLVRDYSQKYDARTMPEVYDLTFVEEMTSPTWDHTRYVPDVVFIALSTNDFSKGDALPTAPRPQLDVAMYRDAYVAFVTKLRGYYPNAEIFALTSQLLDDANPPGAATAASTALTQAVAQLNTAGDAKVHFFMTTRVAGRACSGHPDAAQHQQLADELTAELRRVLGLP